MSPDRLTVHRPPPYRVVEAPRRITRGGGRLLTLVAVVVLLGLLGLAALGVADRGPFGTVVGAVTSGGAHGTAGPLGRNDGYLAVGASVSPFSRDPVVERLEPGLLAALRRAATAARADGIEMRVNSGWRSDRYQRTLLRRAVKTYGGLEVARQYVKPPEESSHVTGRAVDIGPTDADSWLMQHGSTYGLCQIYANEIWHFELATEPGGTCPAMANDAAGG